MRPYVLNDKWLERPVKVLLAGAGGTGSDVLDGLSRLHIGLLGVGHPSGLSVTVLDADTVSSANVGRQRFSPADVGQNKAVTLVTRYNLFFGLNWRGLPVHLEQDEMEDLHRNFDIVVTCVDRPSVRAAIGAWSKKHRSPDDCSMISNETLWLDFGNGRTTGQVVLGHLTWGRRDCQALPNVYDLYPELATMGDDEGGPSCSMAESLREQDLFVNRWAGLGIGLLWQLLSRGEIENHGFFFDALGLSATPLRIDPTVWSFLGYSEQ